ncbi:IclR family transcriptional regulator [Sphingobium cloacae]|uniref:IclR family transcriptional regulator n=1 Tax=Sphingobium cloacae TaxID=120107 RepID=A0A1E1EZK1_9SPHN|nr:helix-turn-helix domain-containing protein [Sphingobium cloacae]BAV63695.1 IclR family transcriptional regulator [Sphingobium cloacae]
MTGPVRSVSQAFAIIRLLAEGRPLSLSDIGRSLGLSPSSGLNLLRTLVEEGIVERDAQGKRYQLAQAWSRFDALREGGAQGVVDRSRPLLARFARTHDVSTALWQLVPGGRLRLVAYGESAGPMRIHLTEGQRQPLGGGAVGRALAAAQEVDDEELERRFSTVRWQSALSFAEYKEQVRNAALHGFAVDDGYAHAGICSLAVAMPHLRTGFGLSASIFARSRDEKGLSDLGEALIRLAGAPAFQS